jgi:LPS-assembly protein
MTARRTIATVTVTTGLLFFSGAQVSGAETDSAQSRFDISADEKQFSANGDIEATGTVEVKQDKRVVRAPAVHFNAADKSINVSGTVEIEDPLLHASASSAHVDPAGDADLTEATFELPTRNGHGFAEHIRLQHDGQLDLEGVNYTTCPNPNPDWQLRISELSIDAQQHEGSATNARLEIKGIPIFYTPYLSFPVGSERKTGLLFPSAGASSRSGTSLAVPWYWNIAPNYDATITPTWYAERGLDMGANFRFLTEDHKGTLHGNYLVDDDIRHTDRSLLTINTLSDFTDQLRVNIDATRVSDSNYFEDMSDSTLSSTVVVPRVVQMQYRLEDWSFEARAQRYQVIDQEIPDEQRPYSMLPQLGVHGYFPDSPFGLTAALDAEFVAFRRSNDNVPAGEQDYNGNRLDVMPELRLPIRGASGYIEPAIAWRYTDYQFVDERTPLPSHSASRSLPIASIDSSIIFERITSKGRIQTFEPRLLYLYVPYRNQDALPIFDTARPDLTLIQLFNTNRYVGADRVGDANQVAYGFTTRLLDGANGGQFLSATIGQNVRYSTPYVALPGEVAGIYDRSDVVGELALTAYSHWNSQAALQWNPNQHRAERIELNFQYQPKRDQVINAGYRFREPNSAVASSANEQQLEQVYLSFAWPLSSQINSFGRIVYSLSDPIQSPGLTVQDHTATEKFIGLEYRACCWSMRLLAGRSLATRDGEVDNWIRWQFELKGLSNVGNADTFLTHSIPGYSARTASSTP